MSTTFFVLLVVVPVVEIASIVVMTSWLGGAATFTLIMVSAVVGFLVMRHAGRSWWAGLRAAAGVPDTAGVATPPQAPDTKAFADRGLLFLAGLLLLFPGFVGDLIGLLLLLPFVRSALRVGATAWFLRRFTAVTGPGGFVVWQQGDLPPGAAAPGSVRVERVVPGEVVQGEVLPPDPDSRTAPPQEPRGG